MHGHAQRMLPRGLAKKPETKSETPFGQSNRIACGNEYCGTQPYCRSEPYRSGPSQNSGGPDHLPRSEFEPSSSLPSTVPGKCLPAGSVGILEEAVWFLPSHRRIFSRPLGPVKSIPFFRDRPSLQSECPHLSSAAANIPRQQPHGGGRPGPVGDRRRATGRYRLPESGASVE
jgi:hypothetical protein